jgi:hypothetical protein
MSPAKEYQITNNNHLVEGTKVVVCVHDCVHKIEKHASHA